MSPDWASIGVMLAVGGLLWRQIHALSMRVDALAADVRDIDRRLARLEGVVSVALRLPASGPPEGGERPGLGSARATS